MRFLHKSPSSSRKQLMGNLQSCIVPTEEETKEGAMVHMPPPPPSHPGETESQRKTWHGVKPPFPFHSPRQSSSHGGSKRRTWHGPKERSQASVTTEQQSSHHHRRQRSNSFARGIRQNSIKATHAVGHWFQSLEEFFFPKMSTDLFSSQAAAAVHPPKVRGGVLLEGCKTAEEHKALVQDVVSRVRTLRGADGLAEAGFEYRTLQCEAHTLATMPAEESDEEEETEEFLSHSDGGGLDLSGLAVSSSSPLSMNNSAHDFRSSDLLATASVRSIGTDTMLDLSELPPPDVEQGLWCHLCMRRLYHVASGTLITEENRKLYIADGDMYEELARLCQEYCHDLMIEEAQMQWVTIEDSEHHEPIRALVNSNHPMLDTNSEMKDRPTVLIATGRGKVRAGIFSRQHLICSGLESSTALPIVREAMRRQMNVIIVDPNVHGDRMGFVTFEKTMDYLHEVFQGEQSEEVPLQARDLYVLSHSASGGHLARYLLDKSEHYLPHIRAIAFTDSTHNIQWCKSKGKPELYQMLESNKCVYFRCSTVRQENNDKWYLHSAGEEVNTDSFWQHRFGKIKTYWAGTNEHSLTNWYAHRKIWEHFDQHLAGIDEDEDEIDEFSHHRENNFGKVIRL